MRKYLFLFMILPLSVSADVYITEIAWMGDSDSFNNEWIEIYNDGTSTVDLSSWSIEASDGSPAFSLFGNISSGGYKVFDREQGDYSGALSNSGETLTLYNGSSAVDVVSGGDNWENIGGDNDTKKTPQLTSSGWITDSSTKGYGSDSSEDDPEDEEEEVVDTPASNKESFSVIADIEAISSVVVGMSVEFVGTNNIEQTSGIGYRWNFGDGSTGHGPVVHHTFIEPGKYTVSLVARRLGTKEYDSIVIEVKEANLYISKVVTGINGYIEIVNDTNVEVDLSGWLIKNAIDAFRFPEMSYVAPKSSIRIVSEVLKLESINHVILTDYDGRIVSSYPRYEKKEIMPAVVSTDVKEEKEDIVVERNVASVGLSSETPDKEKGLWFWLSILMLIIAIPSISVFMMNRGSGATRDDDIEVIT